MSPLLQRADRRWPRARPHLRRGGRAQHRAGREGRQLGNFGVDQPGRHHPELGRPHPHRGRARNRPRRVRRPLPGAGATGAHPHRASRERPHRRWRRRGFRREGGRLHGRVCPRRGDHHRCRDGEDDQAGGECVSRCQHRVCQRAFDHCREGRRQRLGADPARQPAPARQHPQPRSWRWRPLHRRRSMVHCRRLPRRRAADAPRARPTTASRIGWWTTSRPRRRSSSGR